jgi:hypothetical protein
VQEWIKSAISMMSPSKDQLRYRDPYRASKESKLQELFGFYYGAAH